MAGTVNFYWLIGGLEVSGVGLSEAGKTIQVDEEIAKHLEAQGLGYIQRDDPPETTKFKQKKPKLDVGGDD